jgi:hypothetical protein
MSAKLSKFFGATVKRTAMNMAPMLKAKETLISKMAKMKDELEKIYKSLEEMDAPIKTVTGGYGVEDLIKREDGKWVLKYPDTIVPPTVEECTHCNPACDESGCNVASPDTDSENQNVEQSNSEQEEAFNDSFNL